MEPKCRGRVRRGLGSVAVLIGAVALVAPAFSSSAAASAAGQIRHGRTATVLFGGGNVWPELDPNTNTADESDTPMNNAIFGELFAEGPSGVPIPSEASGYTLSDRNLQININLRHNVHFSDGTLMTAAAVQTSIQTDLMPVNACLCDSLFTDVTSITTSGPFTVVLNLKTPDAAIIKAFYGNAPNWTVDPTALSSMGIAAYSQDPVGAGPFKVASNSASSTLDLVANRGYFVKGEPYLNGLNFVASPVDQTSYSALQTGEGQIASGIATISILQQAKHSKTFEVITPPADELQFLRFNSLSGLFANPVARDAIAYATNPKALTKYLYDKFYTPTESLTGPGNTFYEPVVPGARTYNLKKAKALVQQLGGMTVNLATFTNTAYWQNEAEVLAAQWEQAGIQVNIQLNSEPTTLAEDVNHNYEVMLINWGEVDNGLALPNFFSDTGHSSALNDPTLMGLEAQGLQFQTSSTRARTYDKINQYIDQEQYGVFLYSKSIFLIINKSVQGISNSDTETHWATVWLR
jgi:peptide/nickel transport system substrate-binding protein